MELTSPLLERLTPMIFQFKIPHRLQLDLTSRVHVRTRFQPLHLIRLGVLTAGLLIAGCSTYLDTVKNIDQSFEQSPKKIPFVDLTGANWQKFSVDQPNTNPLRMAIIARDEQIGLTRVVVKAPPDFSLPPHWFTVQGTYTVLKGTFVFDGVDTKGNPNKLVQHPGDFATIPANFILRPATQSGDEALLYITVYGDWSPKLPGGAWGKPLLRGAN